MPRVAKGSPPPPLPPPPPALADPSQLCLLCGGVEFEGVEVCDAEDMSASSEAASTALDFSPCSPADAAAIAAVVAAAAAAAGVAGEVGLSFAAMHCVFLGERVVC